MEIQPIKMGYVKRKKQRNKETMKHSRITIHQNNGHDEVIIAKAIKAATKSLDKRIGNLKKEHRQISESMMCVRIKLTMVEIGFAIDLSEVEIEFVGVFNGFANFIVTCEDFDIEFKVTIDMEG